MCEREAAMSKVQECVGEAGCGLSMCAALSSIAERERLSECLKTQAELCARIVESAKTLPEAAARIRKKFGEGGI